jgi:AraC-like DNA-binding protein
MKYATLRRIGEAQNLLINTDMTITAIAAQIGYNNSNYFQNAFRNAVGISPGEYRKKWTK